MAKTVNFRTPDGDKITIKLVDLGGGGVTFEPVSDNANNIHHHAFEDNNGEWNILIRDRYNQNIAAYVLDKHSGSWNERALSSSESRRR